MATNARAIGPLTRLVAAEIRATRVRLKIGQEELSRTTGIPPSSLSQMERGKMSIDVEQIEQIASAFGMAPDKLISSALANAAVEREYAAARGAATGDGATTHPEDDWRLRTPSKESLDILRAEAEANPGS